MGICVLHRLPAVGDNRQACLNALGLEAPLCARIVVCSWHFKKNDLFLSGFVKPTAVPPMVRGNLGGIALVSNIKV